MCSSGMTHVMAERGYSIVKPFQNARPPAFPSIAALEAPNCRRLPPTNRRDCFDDLSRFGEVVGDPDGLPAVTFPINDFPARRNFPSGRLPDCQGAGANEKIVGLIAIVPGGIEDRDMTATGLRSLGLA